MAGQQLQPAGRSKGALRLTASLAGRAGAYGVAGARMAAARFGGKTGMKRESGAGPSHVSSGPVTTFQKDSRVTYTRRRAPKRVRTRARRSFKTFQKHLGNLSGLKRYVSNDYNGATAVAGQQAVMNIDFMNYTDMGNLFGLFQTEGAPITIAPSASIPWELLLRKVRMEVEFKNPSTSLAYVDLYYYYPRSDMTVTALTTLSDSFGASTEANAGTVSAAGNVTTQSNLVPTLMGITPFDIPMFTQNFVIYKTRRVMLQAGQSFSIDMKARPGNQSTKSWTVNILGRKNITSGVLVYFSGEVNSAGSSTNQVSLAYHRQLWASATRLGGKGPTSQTFIKPA
nr:MAG TPA: Putative capsid protein [Cressdnaviricota sp.]